MPDISMCGRECAASTFCRRHPDSGTRPDPYWQAWFAPERSYPDCAVFWPVHEAAGATSAAPAIPTSDTAAVAAAAVGDPTGSDLSPPDTTSTGDVTP